MKKKSHKGVVLRRTFTSKKGKIFDARDYGHECWPIGKGKKKAA